MSNEETRGGKRRNAGRKIEVQGAGPVKKKTVTLDETSERMLKVLGGGELSKGIRIAGRYAYAAYQDDRLKV